MKQTANTIPYVREKEVFYSMVCNYKVSGSRYGDLDVIAFHAGNLPVAL